MDCVIGSAGNTTGPPLGNPPSSYLLLLRYLLDPSRTAPHRLLSSWRFRIIITFVPTLIAVVRETRGYALSKSVQVLYALLDSGSGLAIWRVAIDDKRWGVKAVWPCMTSLKKYLRRRRENRGKVGLNANDSQLVVD